MALPSQPSFPSANLSIQQAGIAWPQAASRHDRTCYSSSHGVRFYRNQLILLVLHKQLIKIVVIF
jgi:hypothetical protein